MRTARCVPNPRLLRNALVYARAFDDVVLADHCEDASLAENGQMHEGFHSYSLGLRGQPAEAEEVIVARDVAIARMTGTRLHICHLSSARSVELVRRAKAEGIRVTAEVTPHHLVFTDDDLVTYDTDLKVNPPLRSPEDRDALRAGVADGTIDAIATDHAPHASVRKDVEFDQAAFGISGLETALSLVLGGVNAGWCDLDIAIRALTDGPARVLGITPSPDDWIAIDVDESWIVGADGLVSLGKNTPLLGQELRGRVVQAVVGGEVRFEKERRGEAQAVR